MCMGALCMQFHKCAEVKRFIDNNMTFTSANTHTYTYVCLCMTVKVSYQDPIEFAAWMGKHE